MEEKKYVVTELKSVEASSIRPSFSPFLSWGSQAVGYRGVDGEVVCTYNQFVLKLNRRGGVVEFRVVPFKAILSYSVTEVDSTNRELTLWLKNQETIVLKFVAEELGSIIKRLSVLLTGV